MDKKLTLKQKMFVEHYVANGYNGTQAAISAGYSKKTANEIAAENLAKPSIDQYKSKLMSKLADSLGMDQKYVLTKIKSCADLDPFMKPNAVLKACELLGKHHGMFVEKVEVKDKTHEDWLEEIKDE